MEHRVATQIAIGESFFQARTHIRQLEAVAGGLHLTAKKGAAESAACQAFHE